MRWNDHFLESSGMSDQVRAANEMRRAAEVLAQGDPAGPPDSIESALPVEMSRVLHELRVHQIELEMQNEELRRSQMELEASHARYFELYDLAPIGYCTLNEQGLILQANICLTSLLGESRDKVVKRPLSDFIHPEDEDKFYLYRRGRHNTKHPDSMELRMLCTQAPHVWVKLEASGRQDPKGTPELLVTVTDITGLKLHEDLLGKFNMELETKVSTRTRQIERMSSRMLQVQEDECKRIAGELHDSLGQSLCAIRLMVGMMVEASPIKWSAAGQELNATVMTALIDAIEEVRQISMNLRPTRLDNLSILKAISLLVGKFQVASPSIQVTSRIDCEEEVIPEVLKITLFRIVQEALTNTANHSKATELTLTLRQAEGRLTLTASDNGQGFNPMAAVPDASLGGLGLVSMRERAEFSGGTLEVNSSLGVGTQITASWPLPLERPSP